MIQAIIFDFNGVIADDEAPHVTSFQQALDEAGLQLTRDDYYGIYWGMDERACARTLLLARDGSCDERLLSRIMNRKADLFRAETAERRPALFPGIIDFVKMAKDRFRLAIASGGRREQIAYALEGTPIEQDFEVIITTEDCAIGKPDPAIYRSTLEQLNATAVSSSAIGPAQCLVIEDSLAGIRSALSAGMSVLALATTYPVDKLCEADHVLPNLRGVSPQTVIAQIGQTRRVTRTQPE